MTVSRRIITLVSAFFGAGVVASVYGVAVLFISGGSVLSGWSGWSAFHAEIRRIADARPDGAVVLAELSGHGVTQACWLGEYVEVLDVAERRAWPPGDLPDVAVGENHFGLLLIGDGRVSYGELGLYDVDQDALYATGGCVEGTRLALVFDAVDPLAGGRIVDLDAR